MNNQSSIKSSLIGGVFLLYALSILVGTFVLMNYDITADASPDLNISETPVEINTPNFSKFIDVSEKKAAFFHYLLPGINKKNQQLLSARELVLRYLEKQNNARSITDDEKSKLESLKESYKTTSLDELIIRIDQIPASLALAQAATESGWGSSRFAREGNNFFGQWCYTKGCGLVPLNRNQGATHEVKVFTSVDESISAYFDNLNTNAAYNDFRSIRLALRNENQTITGKALAEGLIKYSEKGYEYVEMIQSMIASNNLESYDVRLAIKD